MFELVVRLADAVRTYDIKPKPTQFGLANQRDLADLDQRVLRPQSDKSIE